MLAELRSHDSQARVKWHAQWHSKLEAWGVAYSPQPHSNLRPSVPKTLLGYRTPEKSYYYHFIKQFWVSPY